MNSEVSSEPNPEPEPSSGIVVVNVVFPPATVVPFMTGSAVVVEVVEVAG